MKEKKKRILWNYHSTLAGLVITGHVTRVTLRLLKSVKLCSELVEWTAPNLHHTHRFNCQALQLDIYCGRSLPIGWCESVSIATVELQLGRIERVASEVTDSSLRECQHTPINIHKHTHWTPNPAWQRYTLWFSCHKSQNTRGQRSKVTGTGD